jgi:hypothetical protein
MDTVETSVGANATVNLFTGRQGELIDDAGAEVEIYAVAAATGVLLHAVVAGRRIAPGSAIPAWAAANRGPVVPDDIMAQGAGIRGDRCIIEAENTTGAAVIVRCTMRHRPVL